MQHYIYDGPVLEFGVCISNNWKGVTFAISEKKAKSNLIYQFKKENNRMSSTKISLPGKLRLSE